MGFFDGILNYNAQMYTNASNERLMREGWAREDSAYQRKVADLEAAGLNPILAAGGSGSPSSSPIQKIAPKIETPDFLGKSISLLQAGLSAAQAKKNIAMADAEKENIILQREQIKEETERLRIANEQSRQMNPLKLTEQWMKNDLSSKLNPLLISQKMAEIEKMGVDNVLHSKQTEMVQMGINEAQIDIAIKKIEEEYTRKNLNRDLDLKNKRALAMDLAYDVAVKQKEILEYNAGIYQNLRFPTNASFDQTMKLGTLFADFFQSWGTR